MSSIGPMGAASGELQMPTALRWYLAHERAILAALVVMLFLIGWEGLECGWWADLLRPLLGAEALAVSDAAAARAAYIAAVLAARTQGQGSLAAAGLALAGWYPDPWRQAWWRWWDGGQWTGYVSK